MAHAGGDAGGATSSAGDASVGDAGETSNGGATAGNAGGPSGGSAGSSGASGVDCAKLKQQYESAVAKARACDAGSTDECSPSSSVEPLSCGCAVLVNARSEFTAVAKKARQAYRDAKCVEGVACAAIACVAPVAASCAQGIGSASSFVCAAVTAVAN